MNNTTWTLEQGLEFARQLEVKIKRISSHYHVGLTGSTLYKGESKKDLDIILYPHKSTQKDRKYLDKVLIEFGLKFVSDRTETYAVYGNDKEVVQYSYKGKRVDIFFLE